MDLSEFKAMVRDEVVTDKEVLDALWKLLMQTSTGKDAQVNTEAVIHLRFKSFFEVIKKAESREKLYSSLVGLFRHAYAAIGMIEEEDSLAKLDRSAADKDKSDEEVEKLFDKALEGMKDVDGRRKVFDLLQKHRPLREALFVKKLKENSVHG